MSQGKLWSAHLGQTLNTLGACTGGTGQLLNYYRNATEGCSVPWVHSELLHTHPSTSRPGRCGGSAHTPPSTSRPGRCGSSAHTHPSTSRPGRCGGSAHTHPSTSRPGRRGSSAHTHPSTSRPGGVAAVLTHPLPPPAQEGVAAVLTHTPFHLPPRKVWRQCSHTPFHLPPWRCGSSAHLRLVSLSIRVRETLLPEASPPLTVSNLVVRQAAYSEHASQWRQSPCTPHTTQREYTHQVTHTHNPTLSLPQTNSFTASYFSSYNSTHPNCKRCCVDLDGRVQFFNFESPRAHKLGQLTSTDNACRRLLFNNNASPNPSMR